MKDPRVPFDKALKKLGAFLVGIGLSNQILWLSRDRIVGHQQKVWVYQPQQLEDPAASRRFYESLRKETSVSLRIDVLCQYEGQSLCYVENLGGESAYLNFGAKMDSLQVDAVESRPQWIATKLIISTRRDPHPITRLRITPVSE